MRLVDALKDKPVLYVARDIERALGLSLPTDGFHIISNSSPYATTLVENIPDTITIVPRGIEDPLDTTDLLESVTAEKSINKQKNPHIVVFKNTLHIERITKAKKWNLINPPAALAREVEEKISQVRWLEEDASLLAEHTIAILKHVHFKNKPLVVQFNHSHTGEGTFLIRSESDLKKIAEKFPERDVRVTTFIEGPVFTLNAVVAKDTDETFLGNTSYQITGINPFTDLEFSTIGNDWSLPEKVLSSKQQQAIHDMARKVGSRLKNSGWKGLFGIDVIYDPAHDKMHLIEINSRQPASAVFESNLQRRVGNDMTIFEAHLCALLELPLKGAHIQKISGGSQIVQRVTQSGTKTVARDSIHKLRERGYYVAEYENTELNKELVRVQTAKNIMEKHNQLSHTGKEIRDIIHTA